MKIRKKFLIIVIIVFVFLIFIVFKFFNKLELKNITIEAGSPLSTSVNDYLAKQIKDDYKYSINLDKVEINTVGEYEYTISSSLKKGTGTITVVDTKPPKYTLGNLVLEKNSSSLASLISFCYDYSGECNLKLKEKNVSEVTNIVGLKEETLIIYDKYDNSIEEKITIEVVDAEDFENIKLNTIKPGFIPNNISDFNNVYWRTFKIAYPPSELLNVEKYVPNDMNKLISEYVSANYPEYQYVDFEIYYLTNQYSYFMGIVIKANLIYNGKAEHIYIGGDMIKATSLNIQN